jgi:ubiquitin carboxyl-terminal hydrolase 25/28
MPKKYLGIKDEEIQKHAEQDFEFKRKLASCRLVESLKYLFASLIASDRKYIDPTTVISSIVDDYGNDLAIGDQKDIGEFNLIFLSRIEDGLEESRKGKEMEVENRP